MARARGRSGTELMQRRHARLRPLLPLPAGARTRSGARDAPQRRRHERDVRRRRAPPPRWRGSTRRGMRYALSYAAQQVSGLWSWVARHRTRREGVRLCGHGRAQRRHRGADGADGIHAACRTCSTASTTCSMALSTEPHAARRWSPDLGDAFLRHARRRSRLFSVGYPIQAPLDAFLTLRREHASDRRTTSARIVVSLPEDGARIVDNSAMPDVNCQYIIAVALIDGTVSFDASHSHERMNDPQIRAVKSPRGAGGRSIADGSRCAAQRARRSHAARRTDGEPFHAPSAGTKENPLTTEA